MVFYIPFILLLGASVGSFINVIIYRFPQNKSIILPRSFCPKCLNKIKWYDNIPLFSYFLLNAKCRKCKTQISIEYLLIPLRLLITF